MVLGISSVQVTDLLSFEKRFSVFADEYDSTHQIAGILLQLHPLLNLLHSSTSLTIAFFQLVLVAKPLQAKSLLTKKVERNATIMISIESCFVSPPFLIIGILQIDGFDIQEVRNISQVNQAEVTRHLVQIVVTVNLPFCLITILGVLVVLSIRNMKLAIMVAVKLFVDLILIISPDVVRFIAGYTFIESFGLNEEPWVKTTEYDELLKTKGFVYAVNTFSNRHASYLKGQFNDDMLLDAVAICTGILSLVYFISYMVGIRSYSKTVFRWFACFRFKNCRNT